jgi:hypothetical protein
MACLLDAGLGYRSLAIVLVKAGLMSNPGAGVGQCPLSE